MNGFLGFEVVKKISQAATSRQVYKKASFINRLQISS